MDSFLIITIYYIITVRNTANEIMNMTQAIDRIGNVLRVEHDALSRLQRVSVHVWQNAMDLLRSRSGKLIVAGIGKSGYIAMKGGATFNSLGQHAVFVHPVEAMHGDAGVIQDGDVLIVFSYSGNTKELVQFVSHITQIMSVKVLSIVGNVDSALAALSEVVIPVDIEEEGCPLQLAPMASTVTMLAIADALAAGLTSPEEFTARDFVRYHPFGSLGFSLTPVKERMLDVDDITVLGETGIKVALRKMTDIGKGILGVVDEENKLIGVVTDGDVRRFFSSPDSKGKEKIESVMTGSPKCIGEGDSLMDALTIMNDHKITSLFVVDERKFPVGVIHIHDII